MQFVSANRKALPVGTNSPVAIDAKNLGGALAGWLAERLRWLAEEGTGYPDLPSVETNQDWEAQLTYVADSLDAYHEALVTGRPSADVAMDAEQAIHWVALHLHDLWD